MSPAVALRLTLPAAEMTDSLVVPATPALVMVTACAACTSTVPLPPTVMSPAEPKVTLPVVATRLTEPPAVVKPRVTLRLAPCSSKLPKLVVPVKATAWLTLKSPTAVTTTEPLTAVTPDWAASVRVGPRLPSACTRLSRTAAVVPSVTPLASARFATPLRAEALRV